MNSRQSIFWLIVFVSGSLWFAFPAITMAIPAGEPADYNNDGKVDAGDYATWRKSLGMTNAVLANDPFGTISIQEHYYWRAHFGNPQGSGLGDTGIPEPTSAALLLIGTITVALMRRRASLVHRLQ